MNQHSHPSCSQSILKGGADNRVTVTGYVEAAFTRWAENINGLVYGDKISRSAWNVGRLSGLIITIKPMLELGILKKLNQAQIHDKFNTFSEKIHLLHSNPEVVPIWSPADT